MLDHFQRPAGRPGIRVRAEGANVLGMPAALAVIETSPRVGRRRLARALAELEGTLRLMRVSTLAFSQNFPYRDHFLQRGFQEGDCRGLLLEKAPEILNLASPSHERVLLSAPRADRRGAQLASRLCRVFRYIVTDIPGDVSPIDDALTDFGVTLEPLRRDCAADVDAAVFLGVPSRPVFLPHRCRVLRLCEKSPYICGGGEVERVRFRLPERLRDSVPENFPGDILLSAALESGRLPPGDVAVEAARGVIYPAS